MIVAQVGPVLARHLTKQSKHTLAEGSERIRRIGRRMWRYLHKLFIISQFFPLKTLRVRKLEHTHSENCKKIDEYAEKHHIVQHGACRLQQHCYYHLYFGRRAQQAQHAQYSQHPYRHQRSSSFKNGFRNITYNHKQQVKYIPPVFEKGFYRIGGKKSHYYLNSKDKQYKRLYFWNDRVWVVCLHTYKYGVDYYNHCYYKLKPPVGYNVSHNTFRSLWFLYCIFLFSIIHNNPKILVPVNILQNYNSLSAKSKFISVST